MSEIAIKNISSQQAWEMLGNDPQVVLLDVRTRMEYEYVGHAPHAVNIPWMDAPDWRVDEDFVSKVTKLLQSRPINDCDQDIHSTAILAMCRSGKRSWAALHALSTQGFNCLYNIEDGFEGDLDENRHRNTINGWRASNLPWRQS